MRNLTLKQNIFSKSNNVFGFSHAYILIVMFMSFANVGPERLVVLAPTTRREDNRELALPRLGGDAEEEIAQNLKGLTDGIPDYKGVKKVPRQYQRHTIGVTPRMHRLLRRVVWVVVCYREQNPPQWTPRLTFSAIFE